MCFMVRSSKCILLELRLALHGLELAFQVNSVLFFKTKWLRTIETLNVLRNIQNIRNLLTDIIGASIT